MSKKTLVRVLNPASPGLTHLKLKTAMRHVSRGIARWEGDALRFIEDDHRCVSARENVTIRLRAAQERGYDAIIRHLSLREVKRFPIAGDAVRCFMLQTTTGPGYRRVFE